MEKTKQRRSDQTGMPAAYAGFWKRMLAHNIDLLPILGISYLLSFLLPKSDFDFLMLGVIYMLYHSLFEASDWQATPGKKWVGIAITNRAGNRIHVLKALLRNGTKSMSLLLFFLGFVMISFNPQRRGLHDYIAGTLVLLRSE